MTTRATMKAEILADMRRSSTLDGTRVISAISAAIKFYQPSRFFFNESRSVTFPTVASTTTYSWATIGTEFYWIDGVFITDGSDVIELDRARYADFEAASATSERPTDYSPLADGLIVWPSPDAVYTIRLDGHVKLAEPAADATAGNAWFTEAYELIKCRAKAYLYGNIWQDPIALATIKGMEAEALSSLRSATSAKVMTGYVEATEF